MSLELTTSTPPASETIPSVWLTDLVSLPWHESDPVALSHTAISFLDSVDLAGLVIWPDTDPDALAVWGGPSVDLRASKQDPLIVHLSSMASGLGSEPVLLGPDLPPSGSPLLESWLCGRRPVYVSAIAGVESLAPALLLISAPEPHREVALAVVRLLAQQMRTAFVSAAHTRQTQNLAQALRAAGTRLLDVAKSSLTDQLVNGVAHQLNNYLTTILGYSQLLVETGVHSAEEDGYLRRVLTDAERMSSVVGTMLAFARRRHGGPEMIDVNELLQESLALETHELEKHNVTVYLELDPDLPLVLANPYEMQVVFLNVLMNADQAIAAASDRGLITVRSSLAADEPRRIVVEVEDSGPGLSECLLETIFEPFFTTKDRARHSGLGLAVCRNLLTQFNGRIRAASSVGQGATFHIEIPVTAPDE